jgi:hypothetical protein
VDGTVYRRSAGRQAFEAIFSVGGAVAFLGASALLLLGVMAQELQIRLVGGIMFGFFGLLLSAGAITALQRGRDTRVAEVSPDGLWLPEMGRLPWSEIAEVRIEHLRSVGGPNNSGTQQYLRLGVVPKNPSVRARGASNLGW